MTLELFIRYVHFISIITVAGALISEHMLLQKTTTRKTLKRLFKIDGLYGIGVLLILATGLSMWLWVGKGSEFYTRNGLMHIKTTLFLIIGILSIIPSIFFFKNRKGPDEELIVIPSKVFWCLRIEILILFAMPFLAVLIARGISL